MVKGYVEMFQRDVPAEGLHHRKAAGIFKDGTSHRQKILDVLGGRQEICRLEKLESPMNLICVTPTEIQALFSDFKKEGYSSRQTLTLGV